MTFNITPFSLRIYQSQQIKKGYGNEARIGKGYGNVKRRTTWPNYETGIVTLTVHRFWNPIDNQITLVLPFTAMKNKKVAVKDTNKIFEQVSAILRNYGAKKIAIFGSYARGEETAHSDLDILVEFLGRKSLLDLVGIEMKLSEVLNIKVDLLTEGAISPYLIDTIKNEARVIYG